MKKHASLAKIEKNLNNAEATRFLVGEYTEKLCTHQRELIHEVRKLRGKVENIKEVVTK